MLVEERVVVRALELVNASVARGVVERLVGRVAALAAAENLDTVLLFGRSEGEFIGSRYDATTNAPFSGAARDCVWSRRAVVCGVVCGVRMGVQDGVWCSQKVSFHNGPRVPLRCHYAPWCSYPLLTQRSPRVSFGVHPIMYGGIFTVLW